MRSSSISLGRTYKWREQTLSLNGPFSPYYAMIPTEVKHPASELMASHSEQSSEKRATSNEFSVSNGDEALKIVGAQRSAVFSEEYNRKLRMKIDLLIPPICAAVYFTRYLDKTSLNYASVMDFPIEGPNYNLFSMGFYLGALFWQFPAVYLSQKTRVAKYLGVHVVLWGAILMVHAATTSFVGFFVLRILLGMCESCVSPILTLIISMFYKKNEQGKRISWFFLMTGLSRIFGGFVAYGVTFVNSNHLASWKIIYLLLGGLAIVVGLSVLIWLPDSPVRAQFLTQEERIAVLERVRDEQTGTENRTWKREQIVEALSDIRTWLIFLIILLSTIPNGGLSNFSNLIIKSFGYTSQQALILSTPAGAVAIATTLFCGWYSDKKLERMIPIVFALTPTVVGAAMMIGLNGKPGAKGALLLAVYMVETFGSAIAIVYAYNASNTSGHTKKSTINALTMFAFSVGNIIGTEIFQSKDAPGYIPGKIAIMVLLMTQLFATLLLRFINTRLNEKKKMRLEEEISRHGWTAEDVQKEREKHAFLDLTDKQNLYFVYTP